jgi:hypothetical protein
MIGTIQFFLCFVQLRVTETKFLQVSGLTDHLQVVPASVYLAMFDWHAELTAPVIISPYAKT